jgi:hypothetical protein
MGVVRMLVAWAIELLDWPFCERWLCVMHWPVVGGLLTDVYWWAAGDDVGGDAA